MRLIRRLLIFGLGTNFGLLGCNSLLGNEYGYWQPGRTGAGGSPVAGGESAAGSAGSAGSVSASGGAADVGGSPVTGAASGTPSSGTVSSVGGDAGASESTGGDSTSGLAGEGGWSAIGGGATTLGGGGAGGIQTTGGGGLNPAGGGSGGISTSGAGGANPALVELVTKLITPAATDELGGVAKIQLSLSSAPAAVVAVTSVSSDVTEGKVLTPLLRFTPEDWSIAQTLEIQGQSDWLADGDESFQIQMTLASDDARYAALHTNPIKLVNKSKAAFHAVDDGRNGATSTTAGDLSGDGNVVVGSGTGHGGASLSAFRWSLLDTRPFAWLSMLSYSCSASGTNGDGSITVGACQVPNYGYSDSGPAAVRWDGVQPAVAPIVPIADPKADPVWFIGATSVSDDGGAIGGEVLYHSTTNAALWVVTGPRLRTGPCNNVDGVTADLSADGYVSVGRCDYGISPGIFALRNFQQLKTPVSETYPCVGSYSCSGAAESVSSDGTLVVGWTRVAQDTDHTPIGIPSIPFLWTQTGSGDDGSSVSLLRLPAYTGDWVANGVSDDGRIIVGRASNGTASVAVLWVGGASATPILAADYLKAAGLDANLTGWTLADVVAVSRNGRVVAGNGKDPGGKAAAWRAILN